MNAALLEGALRAHRVGNFTEAARLYTAILNADPSHFDALYSFGFLRFQTGEFEASEHLLGRAARINPGAPDLWFTRGCVFLRLRRESDALDAFDKALVLRPGFVEAALNRGALLLALKRADEALASFDTALASQPGMAQGWNNRGNALAELGRFAESVESYDRALALHPGLTEALINRGTASLALQRASEALADYERAAAAQPHNAEALAGRANALFELKRFEEAAETYRRVLAIAPDYPYALGHLAFCRAYCCDWREAEAHRAQLAAGIAAGARIVTPFQSLALVPAPEAQRRAAEIWTADKYPPSPAPPAQGLRYGHDRVRLAYLSADFGEHAVATLMAGVFAHHDRTRFETFAFSFAKTAPLQSAFEHFSDVSGETDAAIAGMLRTHEIDIAVDLMGFTGESRLGVFARKAAPVQVNYLGYAGTMGASYMDYLIADATVIPDDSGAHYSETVIRLPACFLPSDNRRAIAPKPTRTEAGLPEIGFVFCSFNNSYKFGAQSFAIWMRLLQAVDGAMLWLPQGNEAATRNLKREAEARGVAPDRLIFAPFAADASAHLARLSHADLFLDTFAYNAHSTASDALWAGVPLITCPGESFASRVAASALTAIGLPELIADSPESYEALALRLARDRDALAALRNRLARNRATQPLFDTARYTRNLEDAYFKMLAS
jgi:predicted O-linked N-acetylglucosamine transferase (SPINDLY family)